MSEKRKRVGTTVRIGDRIFTSIKNAGRFYGSTGYVRNRINFNDGVMPDGTPIEIIEESDVKSHTFSIKLNDEEVNYLERVANALDVSKAWVMMKLFYYGKERLDEEINKKGKAHIG